MNVLYCTAYRRLQPPRVHPLPPLARLSLQALHRYSELLLLLTGRRPSELLPPTPPSYIVNRVWQLAQSTCVKDFNWVSCRGEFGGDFGGGFRGGGEDMI